MFVKFRYPPDKRPNHQKLGVTSPFDAQWMSLMTEWINTINQIIFKQTNCDEERIASEKSRRMEIEEEAVETKTLDEKVENPMGREEPTLFLSEKQSEMAIKQFYVLRDRIWLEELQEMVSTKRLARSMKSAMSSLLNEHTHAFVQVAFQLVLRGEPTEGALISIPRVEDLRNFEADKHYLGPLEPLHKGLKKKFPAIADGYSVDRSSVENIGLCSRWTIGRVTAGRYSLARGRGAGLGMICVLGLVALLNSQFTRKNTLVFVRNINSRQYRLAYVNIVEP